MITAIVIPVDPSEPVRPQEIDAQNLNAYNELLDGGNLEVVPFERPEASLYLDEEGKHKGLPVNTRATSLAWAHNSVLRTRHDAIAGPAFLVGPVDVAGDDLTVPEFYPELLLRTEKFRVQMQHDDSTDWREHESVFTSWEEAYNFAVDLALKWAAVEEVRVVPELDEDLRRTWFSLGRENPWIRSAYDPPFTVESFVGCYSVEELEERIGHGNWSLGTAFYYRDLCFINQINGGDEWLTIRHGMAFESITFRPIIERGEFASLIRRLLAASREQCQELTY